MKIETLRLIRSGSGMEKRRDEEDLSWGLKVEFIKTCLQEILRICYYIRGGQEMNDAARF